MFSLNKPTQKEIERERMTALFLSIWNKRPRKSEVSGKFLGNKPKRYLFHHILSKSKYKEAAFDEENIILLTAEEHASVELNLYKYEEINKRRNQLKTKYGII